MASELLDAGGGRLILKFVCHPTQCDGAAVVQTRMDQNHYSTDRAEHICAAGKLGALAALLAVATHARGYLGCAKSDWPHRAAGTLLDGLGRGLVFNVPGRSFQSLRIEAGLIDLKGLPDEPTPFKTPVLYKVVRHPLYLGFIVAFWSTPRMTLGHLFFAAVCTAYIVLAIQFEESDLMEFYGDSYRKYRTQVSMLLPVRFGKR